MTAQFPADIPTFTDPDPNATLAVGNHAARHIKLQQEITAVATKLGTVASLPATGKLLVGTSPNNSAWSKDAPTGVIVGTTDTQTLSNKILTSPVINTPTGDVATLTGAQTLTNKTLNTPIITDFTSAQHNHINAVGGGKITSAGITSFDSSLTTISNPYKFRVSRTSAQNSVGGSFVKINFNTKNFDTANAFDNVTNFRYVCLVDGFYQLQGKVSASNPNSQIVIALYKNAIIYARGGHNVINSSVNGILYTDLVQATAGDYFEMFIYTDTTASLEISPGSYPYFSGFLISHI